MSGGHEVERQAPEAHDTVHDLPRVSLPANAEELREFTSQHIAVADAARERLVHVTAAVGEALTACGPLRDVLRSCTTAIARQLGVASARIWTLDRGEQSLLLQASSSEQPVAE